MNTDNLEFFNIPYGTPEWYDFRKTGIGGSEIGVLLGLIDEYNSPAQLYHEKVGTVSPWKEDNEAMFWGRHLEEIIADKWQYWDGSVESYLNNVASGTIIRKCRKVNGYVRNVKYPWLFCSVDRLMNKEGGYSLLTGEALKQEAVLEIKTITDRSAAKWEAGIPVYHIAQVNQYMLVLELDYAEIAILENGRHLSVIPMERSENLCKSIINTSKYFWEKRVEPAKQAFFKSTRLKALGNIAEAEKYDAIIQHLEPDATPGEAYKQFMSERYQKKREEMDLTAQMKMLGMMHKSSSAAIDYFEKQKSFAANKLAKMFTDYGVEWAKTQDLGYLRYFKTKGTNTFRIDNRLRVEIDVEKLERTMTSVDVNYLKWNPRPPKAQKKEK